MTVLTYAFKAMNVLTTWILSKKNKNTNIIVCRLVQFGSCPEKWSNWYCHFWIQIKHWKENSNCTLIDYFADAVWNDLFVQMTAQTERNKFSQIEKNQIQNCDRIVRKTTPISFPSNNNIYILIKVYFIYYNVRFSTFFLRLAPIFRHFIYS